MNNKLLFLLFFLWVRAYCQEKNYNISNQELTVTKSYSPKLSNNNKIRSRVSSGFMDLSSNSSITYDLIEVPVVSTFKPNKASPLTLQRNISSTSGFNNHLDFGFGNRDQLYFDLSNTFNVDKMQSFNIDIVSSNLGNVESSIVKSDRSFFAFGLGHLYSSNKNEIAHIFYVKSLKDNYYGIYPESEILNDPVILDNLDMGQNRTEINFLSQWRFYDSFIKKASLNFNSNFDSFDSNEQILEIKSDMLFSLFNTNLMIIPKFDLVNTFFSQGYINRNSIQSNYSKFETLIQLSNLAGKFKYQVGGKINYMLKISNISMPEIFFNPEVMISYQENKSKFHPYLTINGGIDLNSYRKASYFNPYVAPTLNLIPTQNLYKGKFGVKSSINSRIEFILGTHFSRQKNDFLFKRYAYDNTVIDGYRLANSFGLVYDDITKFGFYSELVFRYNDENTFKFSFINYDYDQKRLSNVWNLPDLESSIELKLRIKDKLNLNMRARLLGERTSAYRNVFLNQNIEDSPTTPKYLSTLTQLKTEFNYRLAEKLQTYVRMQFNFGKDMNQWDYYIINENLFLGGIRYSFDLTF